MIYSREKKEKICKLGVGGGVEWLFILSFFCKLIKIDNKSWKSKNNDGVGALWLKLLAFYSNEQTFKDIHLSIRKSKTVNKNEWKYFGRKLAIEDPFLIKQNICKQLLTQTNE